MRYFIDGYNLIFSFDSIDINLQKQRKLTITTLKALNLPKKTTLVFDAKENVFSKIDDGALTIVFTEKDLSADDYILEKIELSKQKGQICVVSNDVRLKNKAKRLGAQAKNFDQFFKSLKKPIKELIKPKSTSLEVEKYLKVFEKKFKR